VIVRGWELITNRWQHLVATYVFACMTAFESSDLFESGFGRKYPSAAANPGTVILVPHILGGACHAARATSRP